MRSIIPLLPVFLMACDQEFKQSPYGVEDSGVEGLDDLGELDSAGEEDE